MAGSYIELHKAWAACAVEWSNDHPRSHVLGMPAGRKDCFCCLAARVWALNCSKTSKFVETAIQIPISVKRTSDMAKTCLKLSFRNPKPSPKASTPRTQGVAAN